MKSGFNGNDIPIRLRVLCVQLYEVLIAKMVVNEVNKKKVIVKWTDDKSLFINVPPLGTGLLFECES